jgi:lipopolysaccharide transport system ATP-binding protein
MDQAAATAPAIRIVGLGKRYDLAAKAGTQRIYDRVGNMLHRASRRAVDSSEHVWALRDINLDIPHGRVLGVLGRNGSGKSTLMKLLARVTYPTEGEAYIDGRVGALLQVGTGFHQELTGRENVVLSGAILGMSAEQVRGVQDQIFEFADIGRYLDSPVKYYSSGMYLRLAFAVASHLSAEIMLIDEVLSVGDATFQKKSAARIRAIVSAGRTVLFVSHSLESVRELCDSAIVLVSGRLDFAGGTDDAIATYQRQVSGPAAP